MALKTVLDEAKKDVYPIGALRMYSGLMANHQFYTHIQVKVAMGGKKPWKYVATYPTPKALSYLHAGAGVVKDGEVMGPATPELLQAHGVTHPFAGSTIPSPVKGGKHSLGKVSSSGQVEIYIDGTDEIAKSVETAKADKIAKKKKGASESPPEAPKKPEVAPTPVLMAPTQPDSADSPEVAASVADAKAKHAAKMKADAEAALKAAKDALTSKIADQAKQDAENQAKYAAAQAKADAQLAANKAISAQQKADMDAAMAGHPDPHTAPSYDEPDLTFGSDAVNDILAQNLKGNASLKVSSDPQLMKFFQKLVDKDEHAAGKGWIDALGVATAMKQNPSVAAYYVGHPAIEKTAKKIAAAMGIAWPEPSKPPKKVSLGDPEVLAVLHKYDIGTLSSSEIETKHPEVVAALNDLISPNEKKDFSWKGALYMASQLQHNPDSEDWYNKGSGLQDTAANISAALNSGAKKKDQVVNYDAAIQLGDAEIKGILDVLSKMSPSEIQKALTPGSPDGEAFKAVMLDYKFKFHGNANAVVAAYPALKKIINGLKDDEDTSFDDALNIAANLLTNPNLPNYEYLSKTAKKFALALGVAMKNAPPKEDAELSMSSATVAKALKAYSDGAGMAHELAKKYPGLEQLFAAYVPHIVAPEDMGPSGANWADALLIASHIQKLGLEKAIEKHGSGDPHYIQGMTKIAQDMGLALPTKKKKKKDAELTITSPEITNVLDTYIDGGHSVAELGQKHPEIVEPLTALADESEGGNWMDAFYVAAKFHKDPSDGLAYYAPSVGVGAMYSKTAKKVADAMGISTSSWKKKAFTSDLPPPSPVLSAVEKKKEILHNAFSDIVTEDPASHKDVIAYYVKHHDLKDIIAGLYSPKAMDDTDFDLVMSTAINSLTGETHPSSQLVTLVVKDAVAKIKSIGQPPVIEYPDEPDISPDDVKIPASSGASMGDLVTFLKAVGFGDASKQKAFLDSPAFKNQVANKFGKSWLKNLAKNAPILGIDPVTLEPTKKKKDPESAVATTSIGSVPAFGGAAPVPQAMPAQAEKPAPADLAPQGQGVALVPPQVPALAQLKKGTSAKSLGGAGKKDFYNGKSGQKYLVKLAIEKNSGGIAKPFAAIAQEVFSTVAIAVRPDHVPIKVDTNADGNVVTIQPFLDRGDPPTLAADSATSLTDTEKEDVANEHVLDWLMSQHDSYYENFVRRKDGRIVGVDKEQCFRFFPDDKLDVNYNPNPIEPFYNAFWKAFADKSMAFDPKSMKETIENVEAISDFDYCKQVDRYAKSIWPSEVNKQVKFVAAALERKKNIRADFEKFITGLYQKREANPKGTFTFKKGWDPTGTVASAKPTKKMTTVKAKEWAASLGIKEYDYIPADGPNAGTKDPTKITLKISKGMPKETLEKFAKDAGLTNIGQIVTGGNYHMAFFDKAAYQASSFEKELEKPIEIDPEDSAAVVEVDPHKTAEMNNQDLAKVEDEQLGPLGKRYASDGSGIEGQCMKVKRVLDDGGQPYYSFQFKMRPAMAKSLIGGKAGIHKFPKLTYQPGSDALHEVGTSVGGDAQLSGNKWKAGKSEAFIYTDSEKYSFMNTCVIKVRPKAKQTVKEAFAEALEAMRPGLSAELLKNPSDEDREVAKLARFLWAIAPQQADALTQADHNLDTLKKKLYGLGMDDNDFAHIEEHETYPGLQSHVLPGRHKKLAGGKFKFMFNGISDLNAAVSILKLGLLGISERAAAGIPLSGASVSADVGTGAGDQMLLRPVTESGFGHSLQGHYAGGQYQAIVSPDEADRLDSYMHSGDAFGCCNPNGSNSSSWNNRKSLEKAMMSQQQDYHSAAEIMFRKGIARSKILRMACGSESARQDLVSAAKAQGIVEVNGMSIENFVVVAKTNQEAYDKCVKPALKGIK